MKRRLSILLIFTFLASILFPPELGIQRAAASSSYDTLNTVSVTEDVYGNDLLNHALGGAVDSNELITITTVSERFQVERDWIILELGKGYALNEIYQTLIAQEQGASYETYIQEKYPNALNHSFTTSPESVTFENEPGFIGTGR